MKKRLKKKFTDVFADKSYKSLARYLEINANFKQFSKEHQKLIMEQELYIEELREDHE